MQAIILAAGMGKRLGELTKNNTKCMVEVNGVKIIDRTLAQLSRLELNRIVIVVGYKCNELISHIKDIYEGKTKIEYIINHIYDKTNNIYSLALASKQLQEDDTILLESDLIFEESLLTTIVNNSYPNLALVAKYEPWMNGTMVNISDDHSILNFIPKDSFRFEDINKYYKTINIYKFSKEFSRTKYVPFLTAYTTAIGNDEYYENVLSIITFLNKSELKALPISDERWYEIDDKQDLDIAEALFASKQDILSKYYGRFGGYWRFPKMLDFCYLVNPFFRSSKILDEIQANFRTLIAEYPSGMRVNTLLASKCWGIKEEYIVPGNGAAELIKALMELLPGKIGVTRPTFEEYPNRKDNESIVTFFPTKKDFRYSVNDLVHFYDKNPVDNILLVNPDNPSGNFIPKDDILSFATWCNGRNIRLIVDESFVDFSVGWRNNTLLKDYILEEYPNLMVIKSISKSYGVPGIRLGILCSSNKVIISNIKKNVSIWNLNSFCEFFMQIFSKYEKDYQIACDEFIKERDDFEAKLRNVKFLRVLPSQANYFLVEVLPPFTSEELALRMLMNFNILMRDCSNKCGIDGKQYMRVAIRDHKDNSKLILALNAIERR